MQAVKQPYELLVRWDQDGTLTGAHVQWRHVFKDDDGAIVGETVAAAEPVDIGAGKGFPLADVLDAVQADSLVALSTANAEIEALRKTESR
jgi:16S rRNA G527 N7-methylase RsmG